MRIGVVTFPGSLDDGDAARAARIAGAESVRLWHGDPDLHGVDAVILPGGFSYGDALRCGAIARFAPVMETLIDAARGGMPVLGICNGFQILCEAHLLPGALTRNQHLHFRNRDQFLRIASASTAWTNQFTEGQEILIPVLTVSGFTIILLFNGVVITETIFSFPGMGQWLANAATQLDYAAVLGGAVPGGLALRAAGRGVRAPARAGPLALFLLVRGDQAFDAAIEVPFLAPGLEERHQPREVCLGDGPAESATRQVLGNLSRATSLASRLRNAVKAFR